RPATTACARVRARRTRSQRAARPTAAAGRRPTGATRGTGRARHPRTRRLRAPAPGPRRCRAWRCRVSPPPQGWAWPGRPADPLRAARRRTPRIACSPRAPRALPGRRRSRRRRLHERADPELRLEQRAERVAQQLLRLLRGRLEDHVLRDDDERLARAVGEELAQLVVVPDDLEAV